MPAAGKHIARDKDYPTTAHQSCFPKSSSRGETSILTMGAGQEPLAKSRTGGTQALGGPPLAHG